MRTVLATLGAVLLLAGCGHAAAKDPFVGTWQTDDPQSPKVVIARVSDGYRATIVWAVSRAPMLLARYGNELAGPRPPTVSPGWTIVLAYLPATGHLSLKSTGMDKADVLSKVSDSTAIPSPSPF